MPASCASGSWQRSPQPWPLTDTDNNTRDPHAHLALEPGQVRQVEQCSVEAADPPLAGGF